MTNDILFSRSTASSPFGKCTEDIKAKVPEVVKNDLARLSFHFGYGSSGTSGYGRDIFIEHAYGRIGALNGVKNHGELPVKSNIDDLIAALATLEGISAEQYKSELIYKHLFGHVSIMDHLAKNKMPIKGHE